MNEKTTRFGGFFIAITIAALVTVTSSQADKEALNIRHLPNHNNYHIERNFHRPD
jgi:hypothetical protein